MQPEDVLKLIQPAQDALVKSCLDGWDEWDPSEYPPGREPTLRANIVSAWIWHHAEKILRPFRFVKVVEDGQPYMAMDSRLRVRFKKMDSTGASSNVLTRQQRNLRTYGVPSTQMTLPGIASASVAHHTVYLEVGYVLDPAEQHVERLLVVARGPSRWNHELWVRGHGVVDASQPLPKQAPPPPPAAATLKSKQVNEKDKRKSKPGT